jgi:hypothetical protein
MPVDKAVTGKNITRLRGRQIRIALAACCVVILASCSTTGKTADAGDGTAEADAADSREVPAKGGTAVSGKYVDPMVSTGARQAQSGNRMPAGGQANAAGLPEGTMPGQASSSISGLATQPTGVRAGSFSIFSSPTAPAPPPTQMSDGTAASAAGGTVAAPPSGHLNAANKSVFSAQPTNCGTDANGAPLSC